MEIGVDSFAIVTPDPGGRTAAPAALLANLIEDVETAEASGLDSFGVGEHHRDDMLDSAPPVILAAAAVRTKTIRLNSAVTVLSATDPVRVFQEFATLDLLSKGRAEIAGRGSSIEAFPLFGFDLDDYDALFAEKLGLLLQLREQTYVKWSGTFRPALTGQGVFPRPYQERLPIWLGVGGTPQSFVRAGMLGLPLMVAIIGGDFERFRPMVDLYRTAGARAGFSPEQLKVGVHAIGFVGETTKAAADAFYPGWVYMMNRIGPERGWRPVGRDQFDATMGPHGAYLIGDPQSVIEKALHLNHVLGGVSRIAFQMSTASGDHEAMTRSIQLLGHEVAPAVRREAAKAQAV